MRAAKFAEPRWGPALCACADWGACAVVGAVVRLEGELPASAGGGDADEVDGDGGDGEAEPDAEEDGAVGAEGGRKAGILRWVFHRMGTIGRRSGDVARAAVLRAFGQLAGALMECTLPAGCW